MVDYYTSFDNSTLYFSFSTTSSGNLVWNTWVSNGTSTTATNEIWGNWLVQGTAINGGISYRYTEPELTPEQQAAHEERLRVQMEEYRQREEARKAEEAEAKRRARIILEEHLSDEQRKQLADNAWFEVVTPKGTYRIRTGWSGNVDRIVDGRATDRYCIHPTESVPVEDNMLAQKLLLEADEEAFLRIANRSTPYA